jgi:outer membrane protein insertion porin family
LRAGYQISEALRQTWKYTARSDDITNVASNASLFIKLQEGQHTTSAIGQVLLYDRRDNRIDPTDGYYASIGNDLAGMGFGVRYIRNKVNLGYYYSLWPEWVLSFTAEAGYIFGWGGDQVLLQDRFFVGGDNLRGFAPAGIGPRDTISGDSLGGNKYYVGSVALGVPLGLPKELGINGRVFTDFGSLWGNDQKNIALTPAQLAFTGGVQPNIVDSTAIRASAGVGVSWKSPLGPIRLDLAVPLKKESFDKSQLIHVSFGTRF